MSELLPELYIDSSISSSFLGESRPPKMGPGGKKGILVPLATERNPRAIASSVACCRLSATYIIFKRQKFKKELFIFLKCRDLPERP
jgi:hypothetical protein